MEGAVELLWPRARVVAWWAMRISQSGRVLAAEILDSLPADDPAAKRSRRDLRVINALMGNFRWLRSQLEAVESADGKVLELGAGDGRFGLSLSDPERWAYTGVDLLPRPADWPSSWQWHQGDLFQFLPMSEASVVLVNLFLHHLAPAQLYLLGQRLEESPCRYLLVNEPARRTRHLCQGKLLHLTGLHAVTRHDMDVSIRAGFLGNELPEAMGLSPSVWDWQIHHSFLGAYRLIATRRKS